MNKSHLGIACLTLGFAITGLAQNADSPASTSSSKASATDQFSAVDTNHDGRISRAEARAHGNLGASFATLDADGNNYLSQAEFGKWNAGADHSGASPSDSTQPPLSQPSRQGDSPMPGKGSSLPSSGAPSGGASDTHDAGNGSPSSPGAAQ
jgi:hypothetical protein